MSRWPHWHPSDVRPSCASASVYKDLVIVEPIRQSQGPPCPPSIPGEGQSSVRRLYSVSRVTCVRFVRLASRPCFAGLTRSRTGRRLYNSFRDSTAAAYSSGCACPTFPQPEGRRACSAQHPSADRRPGWSGTIHRPDCTPTGGRSAGVIWPTCTLPAGSVTTRSASIADGVCAHARHSSSRDPHLHG